MPASEKKRSGFEVAVVCGLLLLGTLAVYWPAVDHGFINYDDPEYASANLHVQSGLTFSGVVWAFRTGDTGNWHPLTWLSLMLDAALFGSSAAGFHFTNILLHALNAALLFGLLRLLTGAFWRGALVAALFALHPLRVESVAWITERKDVLSAFFGFLSLMFYARYAQSKARGDERWAMGDRPAASRPLPFAYGLSLTFFALGLMSKSILVTWPFVMLLLDCWPLQRFQPSISKLCLATCLRLVREKIPFFALTFVVSVTTFLTQHYQGAIIPLAHSSLWVRLAKMPINYVTYLSKMVWPMDLTLFYPYPPAVSISVAATSLLLLASVSFLALRLATSKPYIAVGWLWYLGTMFPVIGLVQVGGTPLADRFTYLPLIGVFVALVWGGAELHTRLLLPRILPGMLAVALLAACAWRTQIQLAFWTDSETLFRHALAVTRNNFLAHLNLGVALFDSGRTDEAIVHYRESLRINPTFGNTHNCLGVAFVARHQYPEAIESFTAALRTMTNPWKAHSNLGNTYVEQNRLVEAVAEYQAALRLNPGFIDASHNLGRAFVLQGRAAEAAEQFKQTIRLAPNYAPAHFQLGILLAGQGDKSGAIAHWRTALKLSPDWVSPLNSLAWTLATDKDPAIRDGAEAVRLATLAAGVAGNNPGALDTLAAAYAEAGRFDEAVRTAQRAFALASASADHRLAAEIRPHLDVYQARQPWRE